jgi:hypothetical protein
MLALSVARARSPAALDRIFSGLLDFSAALLATFPRILMPGRRRVPVVAAPSGYDLIAAA